MTSNSVWKVQFLIPLIIGRKLEDLIFISNSISVHQKIPISYSDFTACDSSALRPTHGALNAA